MSDAAQKELQAATPDPAAKTFGNVSTMFLVVIACLVASLFLVVVVDAVWLTGRSSGILIGAATTPHHPPPPPGPPGSTADLQKQVDAAAHENMERDEYLLDKLLLLVGVYSTILSFLALATVIVSRTEAKDQLANLKAEAKALSEGIKTDIAEIRLKAQKDVEKLEEQVRSQFPTVSRFQQRVQDLILELESKYPDDEISTKFQPSTWNTERKQQDAVIDELQSVAVSVVVLDTTELLKLYLVLARSYLVKFRTGEQTDDDAARAYVYSDRAVHISSNSAEAFRMRGICALVRYQSSKKNPANADQTAELLKSARRDFTESKKLDPLELGAFVNLAWIMDEDGNRPEAIRLSEEAIAKISEFSRIRQEKYIPDLYVNFACYLAGKYREETDPALQASVCKQIEDVCTDARNYLRTKIKSSRANEEFRASITKELAEGGDLRGLPPSTKELLEALTVSKPLEAPPAQNTP